MKKKKRNRGRRMMVFLLGFILVVILWNLTEPLVGKNPGKAWEQKVSFPKETGGKERVLSIDDNEEALLWRLRMIAGAKSSIVLATFDLRADESGTDVMAALYDAAERGVKVRLLIDGIYEIPMLRGNATFRTLASHPNVDARIYNPVSFHSLLRLNYRMHDKYLMVDHARYLLGGRNTNNIFLGNYKETINIDRDLLVVSEEGSEGNSLQELCCYFEKIWQEPCVKKAADFVTKKKEEQQKQVLKERYQKWKQKDSSIENFDDWNGCTEPVEEIHLLSNGTEAKRKEGILLDQILSLTESAETITIQTPYVICDRSMYEALSSMTAHAKADVILNAVEMGSNPWGCTDYLNHVEDIRKTGVTVYELMNAQAVHSKAILVDEDLSLVGSYNLDMRSTYLDTELMLAVKSRSLNAAIERTEEEYREKSRKISPEGNIEEGALYQKKELPENKKRMYQILRVITRPIRHLL